MKWALEEHFKTRVVFSRWFWKHGVPPTTSKCPVPANVPVVVLAKDPYRLNESLFDFWKKRRPELNIGDSLSEFVRNPFVLYDNTYGLTTPHYRYTSPTDYWNQYHYAWLHWNAIQERRCVVSLERLVADPDKELKLIADTIGLTRRNPSGVMTIPDGAVLPSSDRNQTFIKPRKPREAARLNSEDTAWISQHVDWDIASHIGYQCRGDT